MSTTEALLNTLKDWSPLMTPKSQPKTVVEPRFVELPLLPNTPDDKENTPPQSKTKSTSPTLQPRTSQLSSPSLALILDSPLMKLNSPIVEVKQEVANYEDFLRIF